MIGSSGGYVCAGGEIGKRTCRGAARLSAQPRVAAAGPALLNCGMRFDRTSTVSGSRRMVFLDDRRSPSDRVERPAEHHHVSASS
jgi:hypothetical protein